jgi:hypothetical protein
VIVKKVPTKKGAPSRSRARHIRDLCDYIAEPDQDGGRDKVEHRGALNLLTLDHAAQVEEMSDLAEVARRDARPVQHWILSWRPAEQPTAAQADEAVRLFLDELGLNEHQAIYALHRDTDNWHLHLAVNRVHAGSERLVTVNGGFDREKAHRAIARIEHLQGWESEYGGRYRANKLGEVERAREPSSPERQPGSRARDLENRTGEQSAQRTAIEEAANLMRQARTWEQVHRQLAPHGLRFERKGSGGIIWVGQTAVKASSAGRDCSMAALTSRLGDFVPAPASLPTTARRSEPTITQSPHWHRYVQERSAHHTAKRQGLQDLATRIRGQWTALDQRHRQQRREILGADWKGSGAALNAVRSLLAARQAGEKASLREEHRRERQSLSQRFPAWPALEEWLRQRDPSLADGWRLRERRPGLLVGEPAASARAADIREFTAEVKGWQIHYRHLGAPSAGPAFTDRGRHVAVHDFSRASVLAAMQLASQKWGSFQVSGPGDYLRTCAKVAAQHGFHVTGRDRTGSVTVDTQGPERPHSGPSIERRRTSTDGLPQAASPLPIGPSKASRPPAPVVRVRDASEAYRRQLDDVRAAGGIPRDGSRVDALIAIRLRLTGHTRIEIERAIRDNAHHRGTVVRDDWSGYARRAAQHAFGVRGDRAMAAVVDRPRLFVLEGREPPAEVPKSVRKHPPVSRDDL